MSAILPVATDSHVGAGIGEVDPVVMAGMREIEFGLDFFAVGEHHRPDFAVSRPEMVLSAIAVRTRDKV